MDESLLEQYLAVRDEPCPACGYNLRKLTGKHCPECGDELRLHVGLVEARRAAFITGLIGLSAGGGFSALLFVYFLIFILRRNGPSDHGGLALGVETVLTGILLIIWIRAGKRLRRRSLPAQWSLAALCCLLAPVNLVIFAALVR